MSAPEPFQAIVVGGGLVGSAIAWGLAREGLRCVLLDEGDIAFRASRGNFGLVWAQSKGQGAPHYQRWTRYSANAWPELARELADAVGADVGLHQPGGVHLCLSDKEMADRSDRMAQMAREAGNSLPFHYRMIEATELREMLPALGPTVVGASFTPYDGHVDPLRLLHALHRAFTGAGGVYVPNAKVERSDAAPRDFRVMAAGRVFEAPRVVLAAGLGNAALAPEFGLSAPVRPQQGQVLVTERVAPIFTMPTTSVRQTMQGSLLLGDSVAEVGYDISQKPAVMAEIAKRAVLSFPFIARLNMVRAWSALRIMPKDGVAIYDQSEKYPGAFTANCHSGVTLAGAHARLLAPMIAAGQLDGMLDPFSARRFDVRDAA